MIYVLNVLYSIKNNHFACIASKYILIPVMMESNGFYVKIAVAGFTVNVLITIQPSIQISNA